MAPENHGPAHRAKSPDLIILSTATHYHGAIFDLVHGGRLTADRARTVWRNGLRKSLERFLATGAQVVVIRDTPVIDKNYRIVCLLRGVTCSTPRATAMSGRFMDEIDRDFANKVGVLDLTDSVCDADKCPVSRDGKVIYRDSTHLTTSFAETFTREMVRLLGIVSSRLAARFQQSSRVEPALSDQ